MIRSLVVMRIRCIDVCIDDIFSKPIVVYRCENAAYEFLKQFLKNTSTAKK